MFDKKAFELRYEEAIATLAGAEKITKEVLRELSRSVLEVLHCDDAPDIRFVNRLLEVLTPMNKRTAIIYFQHFGGFYFNEKEGCFGKKDKSKNAQGIARYEACKAASLAFLEDPLNNIWSWAEQHVKVEAKKVDFKGKIIGDIQKAMKADPKNNPEPLDEEDVINAVFEAGISAETIMRILKAMVEE